jgi:hypothetical protein
MLVMMMLGLDILMLLLLMMMRRRMWVMRVEWWIRSDGREVGVMGRMDVFGRARIGVTVAGGTRGRHVMWLSYLLLLLMLRMRVTGDEVLRHPCRSRIGTMRRLIFHAEHLLPRPRWRKI